MSSIPASLDNAPMIRAALRQILAEDGVVASVEAKQKNLLKFGRNPNIGTSEGTIWFTGQDNANETYVADNVNSIDSISSSNAGDTHTVSIEGHTMTTGDRTFVTQTATLSGQTRVVLTTPLNRVTRVFNTGSTNFAGEIYVYENGALTGGKPNTTTDIHLTIDGTTNKNTSEKGATALSSTDYWIITRIYAGMLEKTGNLFASVQLETRLPGGVFRELISIPVSSGQGFSIEFIPHIIAKPNSDIRLTATGSSTSIEIDGSIQGYLAKIIT